MKRSILYLLTAALIMMTGCTSINEETALPDDDQLIQAIKAATNKQDISAEILPSGSQTVLEQEYFESFVAGASVAPGLGYEVSMGGAGARIGERADVYFNLNGRKLNPANGGIGFGGRQFGGRGMNGQQGRQKCFDLVFPVTFIMPDGSTITVENKDGLTAIKSWREANPDFTERPVLQFPVDIVLKDGTTVTVNSDEEMKSIYRAETKGRHKGKRFEFVYPVTFIMPDGTTVTGNNREEVRLAMRAWHDANPDSTERPVLQYPVDIVLRDGTTVTVNSEEEMRSLFPGRNDT
ncbi:MAG: hypothetical protein GY863_03615 [bacterium]|nr:hypothetical protein [bacterium]